MTKCVSLTLIVKTDSYKKYTQLCYFKDVKAELSNHTDKPNV